MRHGDAEKLQLKFLSARKAAALTIAFSLVAAIFGLSAQNASAASTSSTDQSSVSLISQTSWVTSGSSFDMSLRVATARNRDSLDVVTTVFGPVRSRSAFNSSLKNQIGGAVLILDRRPLATAADASGLVNESYPVSDSSQRATYLPNSGVYPVRVELRDAGSDESIAEMVTYLIRVTDASTKLGVSTVLPVNAQQDPNDWSTAPSNGSEFSSLSTVLGQVQGAGVSYVVSPESTERLLDADGTAKQSVVGLQQTMSGRTLLPSLWTSAAPSVYSLNDERRDQLTRAQSVISQNIGTVTTGTWPALDPISNDGVNYLREQGSARFVIRDTNLSNSNRSTIVTRPFKLKVGSATVPALQADSGLSDHFATAGPLGAHQLLADLAVLYNDSPALNRGVVVEPPSDWLVDGEFLKVYLAGLSQSPIATPATLEDLYKLPSESTRTIVAPKDQSNPSLSKDSIEKARGNLNGFASMVDAANPTLSSLNRELLFSEGLALSNDRRNTLIKDQAARFTKQIDDIRLPAERSIRLTSRQGEIPISIQNDTGYSVKVNIRLTGDQVAFPEGRQKTIDVPRQQVTDRIAIEARGSGAFPVQVEMTSPDGAIKLFASRITVRSTATSGVGIILTIGSLVFLLLWWMHSLWSGHRKKQAAR